MTFPFLTRKPASEGPLARVLSPVRVDVHTHLLPGLDNGPDSLDSSIRMARVMASLGFSKIIATPHIMPTYYPNSIERIWEARAQLDRELLRKRIPIKLEVAAEYYLDEALLRQIQTDEPLLTMGVRGKSPYLLFETSVKEEPAELETVIRVLYQRGIRPLMAHPEQYTYLQENFERAIELFRLGLQFQVNWGSLHSSAKLPARRFVQQLIDYRMVSFAGTNLHHEDEIPILREVADQPYFRLMTEVGLLNNELR